MTGPTLKIICILGWCRNGSTILGNVLNEVPGFFHAGELHFLWKNAAGKGANNRCGCGEPLTTCPLWSQILPLGRPPGIAAGAHADAVIRRQRAWVRTRHTWRVLRRGLRPGGLVEHAALMARTYHGIAVRTGASVLVDSTKIPGEAALLPHLPDITPYYIHLVRDPRAAAESWRERKQYCDPMPAVRSTAYWDAFNLASRALTRRYPERSVLLRYEDFIADPATTVGMLLRWCGADPAANPVHGRTVELHTNHTVTGNPDRFRTGATVIRATDDAWRASLPVPARLTAQALSWPLSRHYGYRSRGRSPGQAARPRVPAARATDET
jgi:sulfotransferase family protein